MSFCAILNDKCPYDNLDCKKCDLGIAYVLAKCLIKSNGYNHIKLKVKNKRKGYYEELTFGDLVSPKETNERLNIKEGNTYKILDISSTRCLIQNDVGHLIWIESVNLFTN